MSLAQQRHDARLTRLQKQLNKGTILHAPRAIVAQPSIRLPPDLNLHPCKQAEIAPSNGKAAGTLAQREKLGGATFGLNPFGADINAQAQSTHISYHE